MIGIGHQVSSKLNILANSISNAVAPEIMTRYGKDDKIGAISLGCDLCLYASVLSLFIFFPIYFWMPQILDLWLKEPPERTSIVIYIMLIDMLLINLTSGFMNLVHATGKIKGYQFTLGTSTMCSVAILYLLLKIDVNFLTALAFAWILPHSFNAISRIYFVKKLLDVPITMYLKRVLIPFIVVLIISDIKYLVNYFFKIYFFVRVLSGGVKAARCLPSCSPLPCPRPRCLTEPRRCGHSPS
jgi:O-antigen/teichoic acid export membrane protein